MTKCIEIFYVIDRSFIGLPPLMIPGYAVKTGRKTRAFNQYGQPTDIKIPQIFNREKVEAEGMVVQRI